MMIDNSVRSLQPFNFMNKYLLVALNNIINKSSKALKRREQKSYPNSE